MSADGKPACGRTRILTDSMALMFTLQQFELSTPPSIPSNGHVGGLC
jgi:hypothetical protein